MIISLAQKNFYNKSTEYINSSKIEKLIKSFNKQIIVLI